MRKIQILTTTNATLLVDWEGTVDSFITRLESATRYNREWVEVDPITRIRPSLVVLIMDVTDMPVAKTADPPKTEAVN